MKDRCTAIGAEVEIYESKNLKISEDHAVSTLAMSLQLSNATIWVSGRTRDRYFVIGASLLPLA